MHRSMGLTDWVIAWLIDWLDNSQSVIIHFEFSLLGIVPKNRGDLFSLELEKVSNLIGEKPSSFVSFPVSSTPVSTDWIVRLIDWLIDYTEIEQDWRLMWNQKKKSEKKTFCLPIITTSVVSTSGIAVCWDETPASPGAVVVVVEVATGTSPTTTVVFIRFPTLWSSGKVG